MKIDLEFYADRMTINASLDGKRFLKIQAIGIDTQEILRAMNDEDAIDLDEIAEAIGKDNILEWAEENCPKAYGEDFL